MDYRCPACPTMLRSVPYKRNSNVQEQHRGESNKSSKTISVFSDDGGKHPARANMGICMRHRLTSWHHQKLRIVETT
eukprot:scaffold70662_cov16-Prasinocladus_malaysianus.AAC.1